MKSILKMLIERAPKETALSASILVAHILNGVDVEEMRTNRGSDFDATQFYQIRVKPKTKGTALPDILTAIEKFLKSSHSKKFGIKDVEINPKSPNSSKYSSVSFSFAGADYDIVVALGGNKGEDFEKTLLLKMDNLIAGLGGGGDEQAAMAFGALEKIDPVFKPGNIAKVTARSGKTTRSGDITPEEAGKIIADIIIELKNGDQKYISIKNVAGATIANFGVSKAFNEDLTVNTDSTEWKSWIAPFGVDAKKVNAGLQAAQNETEVDFDDIDKVNKKAPGAVIKLMQKLWGADYYYLRETKSGFDAMHISREYVDKTLLKNLTITEIRYPSKVRKQITISLQSDSKRFKVEIRNSKGKLRPTEIKFGDAGSTK